MIVVWIYKDKASCVNITLSSGSELDTQRLKHWLKASRTRIAMTHRLVRKGNWMA